LGKHPDPEDPAKLPTKIPLIDNMGNVLWKKKLPDQCWAIDIASDGSFVACATNSLVGKNYTYLWDAAGNEIWKKSIPGVSYDVRFSPDNKRIATGPDEDGTALVLYDTTSGEKIWDHSLGNISCVRQTAFTKNGKHVLVGQTLHLFKAGGKFVWRRYHCYLPYAIWPSSNGKRILVPDKGDCLSMFNIKGKLLWRREQRVITYGVMSANASVIVITTTHGYIFCYNRNGKIKWYHFLPGCKGSGGHNAADITPDGNYIVVGGGGYNTILYDSDGNLLWRHTGSTKYDPSERGYKQSVMAVRISKDGKKIASGYGTSDPKLCYFEKLGDTK
jgi:WD40 repeat protein